MAGGQTGSLLRRLAEARFRLGSMRAKASGEALADMFGEDAETAVLIGRAYLEAASREPIWLARLSARLSGCSTPAEALAELRRAARTDLAHGRSFVFGGWVMAEAQAQACALISRATGDASVPGETAAQRRTDPSR